MDEGEGDGKSAAPALRESEERYRLVSGFTGQLVYDWDVASGRISWAGRTEEITGFDLREMDELGICGWEDHIHPDDRAQATSLLETAMARRETYRCLYRFRAKDGAYFDVEDRGGFVYGDDGRARRMLGVMEDISERKRAEEMRRATEEWFKSLLEGINDVVFSLDIEGHIVYASPSIERLTGYTFDEISGERFGLFVHPDDLEALTRDFERTIGGEISPFEFRLLARDGTVKHVRSSSRLALEGDRAIGLTGTLSDITERVLAEEAIRALNAELEERVRRRTRELESSNRELEAFTYAVSHDLRAPLRAIDGFGRALVEDCAEKLGDLGAGYVGRIRANTQRMAELIDGLLRLSRLSRASLRTLPVDLSALFRAAAEELRRAEPERAVEFRIEPGVVVRGDPALISVVVDNLLRNAWKFTSKRTDAIIEFGVDPSPEGGRPGERSFLVRDNGVGFDMAYVGKLFGAFQRLHSEGEFPGSGIGLATVQRIVHRHGGTVFARGAEGEGATFGFTLPEEG